MLNPLQQWYCDICGKLIDGPKKGYVVWRHDDEFKYHGFTIIHQVKCDDNSFPMSMALEDFLGENGLTYLLSFLSLGVVKNALGESTDSLGSKPVHVRDMDEFVDFFRRVQTPYYEEARKYMLTHDWLERLSDANEAYPYFSESCK